MKYCRQKFTHIARFLLIVSSQHLHKEHLQTPGLSGHQYQHHFYIIKWEQNNVNE